MSSISSPSPAGEQPVGDERVGAALLAQHAREAVAGNETRVVAQRPELAGDRVDQLLVIAAREICAADGALEEHVAGEQDVLDGVGDVAGRVARREAE